MNEYDKYYDLMEANNVFPQPEFTLKDNHLCFNNIDLSQLIARFKTPLKFTYLPKISENIAKAKAFFANSISRNNYAGRYCYIYCTKSSHFKYILEEALKNKVHLEISSAFDLDIIKELKKCGKISDHTIIVCNGFKTDEYTLKIADMIDSYHENSIVVIDNHKELLTLTQNVRKKIDIGIRLATERASNSGFRSNRFGIPREDILSFYKKEIKNRDRVNLKMIHFSAGLKIDKNGYYWNGLQECLELYICLKKDCPQLCYLNIGGGLPIKDSLQFDYNYQQTIDQIVSEIKKACDDAQVEVPNICTEFGSYTVGEAGGCIFKILDQKRQHNGEKWDIIDSSFITTLPDTWAIDKRFIMLPINKWQNPYEQVYLGGVTCDNDDYYVPAENESNGISLPVYEKDDPLFVGFFHTGAYQEALGGVGGLKHCLIPDPKHVLVWKNGQDQLKTEIFKEGQSSKELLSILGYENN